MQRTQQMFKSWYKPKYKMDTSDWVFIAVTALACNLGFGLGLLLGFLWVKLL